MRLASKIFLTSSLVIIVLAGVGVLSVRAVGRLVSVNKEITTQTVPALRRTASVRDGMLSLVRLEARYAVLRDARYRTLWEEQAAGAQADLLSLRPFLTSRREKQRYDEVTAAFERYRRVAAPQPLPPPGTAALDPRSVDTETRALAEQVHAALDGLTEATYARVVAAQAEAARLETRTWTGVLVALGAAVILALMGTAVVAQRMTASLRTLSAATAAVAAGSFRDPIALESKDEIGQLARSFNVMAGQLKQMEDMKEEFFARISHELRSPLTSIREAAHLLRDEIPGPLDPKQARLVAIVGRSADRLLRLVNQILELSRLRAGVLPLDRTGLDLDRIVTRAVDELRPQAQEAGVTLEQERVGTRFECAGDEDRLVQVIVNLVGNAIRFTPRGGRVVVRLIDAASELEIQVEDSGIGIPASVLPYIWESYRQAHRDRGGTGLGLAIVRGVVQAHHGRVTVESSEGKGSRFTVLLPRHAEGA